MRNSFVSKLICLKCSKSDFDLKIIDQNSFEIRLGTLTCKSCENNYKIEEGVVDALPVQLSKEIHHEKEHAESFDYLTFENGEKYPINRDTAAKFPELFFSLPKGDGSRVFQPGGSFDNQAGNAERYFKTLELLNLTGKEKVLEVGASFGWSPWRFAQKGCDVTALDVTNYLQIADLYMKKDGSYFNRIMADMNTLPFKAESFDIIFSHSVIHHCKELPKLFREFHRVLKPSGRMVALHECSFGIFEDKSGKALQEAIEEGFNENAYTVPQWKQGTKAGGFRNFHSHFFSFIEDYIYRKEMRGVKHTPKLKLARKIKNVPVLHDLINGLSIPGRILFRPKAWMMIATK